MDRLLLYVLPPRPQPIAVRYGFSALFAAVSLALFAAMQEQSNFIGLFILLPAIFLAGLMFDRGSSFVATGLAVGGALWLLRWDWTSQFALPLALFIFVALSFGVIAEVLRKQMELTAASEQSKTLLLQEVAHRTKNNLAMLSAMARLQARALGPEGANAAMQISQRIQTMAEVYDHLTLSQQTKVVDLKEYISDIVNRLISISDGKPVAIRCELEQAYVHSEIAVPIAIILNELVTNSLKYGFPDEKSGQIFIQLRTDQDLVLSVSDNGVGMPETQQSKKGIGSKIISLLVQQLDGTLVYEDAQPGCRVILRIPTPKL